MSNDISLNEGTKVVRSNFFSNSKLKVSRVFFHAPSTGSGTEVSLASTLVRSISPALLNPCFSFILSKSVRPHISSTERTPSFAMYSRSSCAMNFIKFSTYSGFPGNRALSFSFWVATPNGQVSRLHTRIIAQPIVISGAVAKPNSSAPSRHAIATSRPLISFPSVSIITRPRRPF